MLQLRSGIADLAHRHTNSIGFIQMKRMQSAWKSPIITFTAHSFWFPLSGLIHQPYTAGKLVQITFNHIRRHLWPSIDCYCRMGRIDRAAREQIWNLISHRSFKCDSIFLVYSNVSQQASFSEYAIRSQWNRTAILHTWRTLLTFVELHLTSTYEHNPRYSSIEMFWQTE